MAAGLPLVVVQGLAPDQPENARLRFVADSAKGQASAGSWQVAMAEPIQAGKGSQQWFDFAGKSWLLCSPIGAGQCDGASV